MGTMSDYAQNLYLTHMLSGASDISALDCWVLLATGAISQADTGATVSTNVEVDGGGYARISSAASDWSVTTTGIASNEVITFASATGSWSTITHFGLADASIAGNLLAFASVATAKAVVSDDIVSFAQGALDVSIS